MKTMVNYYLARAPGKAMWTTGWDLAQIAADFARIAALGANTVRIFVHPGAIGYPVPDPDMLYRVEQVVDLARDHGLRVHLTLFDLYPEACVDIDGSETWARIVLGELYGDPAIACVELHNEIPPDNATAMAWAKHMLPFIRKVGGHPVTVSYTSTNAEDTLDKIVTRFRLLVTQVGPLLDFYDVHYYGPTAAAYTVLGAMKAASKGKPFFIGETGKSTYQLTGPTGPLTQAQAALEQRNYAINMGKVCKARGIDPPAWWTLNNFGPLGSSKENEFGAYLMDGTERPVAAALAAMYRDAYA